MGPNMIIKLSNNGPTTGLRSETLGDGWLSKSRERFQLFLRKREKLSNRVKEYSCFSEREKSPAVLSYEAEIGVPWLKEHESMPRLNLEIESGLENLPPSLPKRKFNRLTDSNTLNGNYRTEKEARVSNPPISTLFGSNFDLRSSLLQQGIPRASTGMCTLEEPQLCPAKWYFSKEEIEDHSPSRKEGIDLKYETHLRKLYCSFLQDLGMKLKVPQLTISCAMLLCHRFYMRHSHAKNDWQTVATACIFLACKVQETPRFLNDVVVVAYEKMNEWDPSASRRIRQREAFDKQKELILSGERLLLSTIAFDLNIQLPYKPLVMALKKLNISSDLAKPAWNFVNDWLCTTMCLQYKPHYIAAGSMFLAAKLQKVKLLTEKGRAWWMEFEVSLKQLEEVIQEMRTLLERDKKQALPPSNGRVTRYKTSGKPLTSSSQSCISSESNNDRHCSNGALAEDRSYGDLLEFDSNSKVSESEKCIPVKDVLSRQSSDNTVSAISVVGDHVGENLIRTGELDQSLRSKAHAVHDMSTRIDVNRIRGSLKKRKCNTIINKVEEMDAEIDSEAWIESELENGIELGTIATTSKEKKQRKL